jgi:hypothetical protein
MYKLVIVMDNYEPESNPDLRFDTLKELYKFATKFIEQGYFVEISLALDGD